MRSTTRTVEFDYLRLAAAAAVVFIHAAATAVARLGVAPGWNPVFLLQMYASFAVPAFIFMTGALVWSRPPAPGLRAYAGFLGHRLRVVVPAYLVWTVIYWLITYTGYGWSARGTGGAAGLGGFVGEVLKGTAWPHLYFVPLIVLIYMLTPLAARLVHRSRAWTLAGSVALAVLWSLVGPSFANVPGVDVAGRLLAYLPFAVCGAWYAMRRTELGIHGAWELRGWWVYLLGGVALQTLYVTGTIGSWSAPLASLARLVWGVAIIVGVSGACARIARWVAFTNRPARALAPLTYWVYLAHPALLVVYYRMTRAYDIGVLWSQPRYLVFKWGVALVGAFVLAAAAGRVTRGMNRMRTR